MEKHIFNPAGKMQEFLEDRQSANKVCWREAKIYQSKDVPWMIKCRTVVEEVYSMFCFGSESWSWSRATLDRMKGCWTK